eukprot:1347670-Alexandrium_andersonii.AAC.1
MHSGLSEGTPTKGPASSSFTCPKAHEGARAYPKAHDAAEQMVAASERHEAAFCISCRALGAFRRDPNEGASFKQLYAASCTSSPPRPFHPLC